MTAVATTHPVNPVFAKWSVGYSGCDGGDIGRVDSRSIWVCGLEWGRGCDAQRFEDQVKDDVTLPPTG